jgi:hypothetical protein
MTPSSSGEIKNPFRPGAGHMPPYLAGREHEAEEFATLLRQDVILSNMILTGLRGLGKTVLLERLKPVAIAAGWLWAGTDLSEAASVSEENLVMRILTDLAITTSSLSVTQEAPRKAGFADREPVEVRLNYPALRTIYDKTPGLASDKLKAVLEFIWPHVEASGRRGIIFAYDEAQNLADHATRNQYPFSLLLDVFQSIQRKGLRFMLVLTGLPTLFPKLVAARTYTERMFHLVFLHPLNRSETDEAIRKPIEESHCEINVAPESLKTIWDITRGYPYFVQYVCREAFDVWVQAINQGQQPLGIPVREIIRKLDSDFFAGRWAKATDRQRDLLSVISNLPNCDAEFSVQDVVESHSNTTTAKPFGGSQVNQLLSSLSDLGLIYKNRHGKYSFAVPLLGDFIRRQDQKVMSGSQGEFFE